MSYEFKGTPGPWAAGFGGGLGGDVISWTCFWDEQGCTQLPVRSGGEAVCVIPHENNPKRHLRDAQLIAAAPELFEALRMFVEPESHIKDGIDPRIDAARAALAKATGAQE